MLISYGSMRSKKKIAFTVIKRLMEDKLNWILMTHKDLDLKLLHIMEVLKMEDTFTMFIIIVMMDIYPILMLMWRIIKEEKERFIKYQRLLRIVVGFGRFFKLMQMEKTLLNLIKFKRQIQKLSEIDIILFIC